MSAKEELLNIGAKMAQELQEFVDEAQLSENSEDALIGTQVLIAEWEGVFAKHSRLIDLLADDSCGELKL